ncbi:MAG: GyrI-like domain-containing protein [Proteobacteria bacterium]|nr:GyrI-like domain-containing protein [Pseudomonadota bacterium]
MEQVKRESFKVTGISVRTTNSHEMNSQTGKIARLWRDFTDIHSKAGQQPALVYGVYSGYASNQHGEFDVTAAVVGDFSHVNRRELKIPAGNFLRFAKNGPCPETVIALWQEVWKFFEEKGAPERAYLVDFEEYTGPESVAIFIGIKEGT